MRKWIFIFLFFPILAEGQLQITVSSGYASSSMRDMAIFQKELHEELPVEGKVISSFPSFWYFDASVAKTSNDLLIGGGLDYTSTGGRISYNDYSGGFTIDQLLSSIGLNAMVGTRLGFSTEKFIFVPQLRTGILMTKFNLAVSDGLGTSRIEETHRFNSLGMTIQPGFSITHRFGRFGVRAFAGYTIQIVRGKLFYDQDKEAYLLFQDDEPLYPDWSGLRCTLGATYYLTH